MDTRSKFVSVAVDVVSTTELYPSLIAAALCAIVGFWRGRKSWEKPETKEYYLGEDLEWSDTVFSAVLLASMLMYFVIQAFKIPSSSMESTLLIGDHLFVNKFIYGLRVPLTGKRLFKFRPVERGDVIVFRFPDDDPHNLHCGSVQYGKDFIKRVIGLPGDVMQVAGGRLLRNGQDASVEPYTQYLDGQMRMPKPERQPDPKTYQEVWQTHQLDRELEEVEHYAYGPRDYFGPVKVPEGAYFAMGDNRDKSCDSRYWGPVEAKFVKGKAWFIYWPPNRMRLVR
ncbi:MAG: signal peptidase I [Elusimicrobia bacterium]|nr:signal peptidase I [Elusimicrobiota bacterium]